MAGRKAARTDATHVAIREAFRRLGWVAVSTAALGDGFPDLLVAKDGVLRQVEVKDGSQRPSRRRLNSEQVRYHRDLAAAGCPVLVLSSVDDVLDVHARLKGTR